MPDPVGRCIYCPATIYSPDDPTHKMGDEHIIPLSIGGTLILRDASCAQCERKTSRLETQCTRALFNSGRMHLGIWGRKQKKLPKTISTESKLGKVKMPPHLHPGVIIGFKFAMPAALFCLNPEKEATAWVTLTPVVPNLPERINKMRGLKINLGGGISAETFGRYLAKIAHSYAVYRLGYGGFNACLPSLIVGDPPYYGVTHFVGSNQFDEPKAAERHTLDLATWHDVKGQKLLVVKVRLFADLGLPIHHIVVGTPL